MSQESWKQYPGWFLTSDPKWARPGYLLYLAARQAGSDDALWDALTSEAIADAPPEKLRSRDSLRQSVGLYLILYRRLAGSMTTDERDLWESRLHSLLREMLGFMRWEDADEALCYEAAFRLADLILGSNYMAATEVGHDTPQRLTEANQERFRVHADGGSDEASEYILNTINVLCLAHSELGREYEIPGFHAWLEKHADYYLWSVSKDLKACAEFGDSQSPQAMDLHYRIPAMFAVASLIEDRDKKAALADLAVKLLGKPIHGPANLYPIGHMTPLGLFVDYDLFDAPGTKELPSGLFRQESAGLVIYRDDRCFLQVYAAPRLNDDHSFMGAFADVRYYLDGKWITDRPGGYGPGDNEWFTHNSAAICGIGWMSNRTHEAAYDHPGGILITCLMQGPYTRPGKSEAPEDFKDTHWERETRLSVLDYSLTVADSWSVSNVPDYVKGGEPVFAAQWYSDVPPTYIHSAPDFRNETIKYGMSWKSSKVISYDIQGRITTVFNGKPAEPIPPVWPKTYPAEVYWREYEDGKRELVLSVAA